jgi:lipopolysaccharide biosynthesis glycosyltransferase
MIVVDSLAPLWDTNIADYPVAAKIDFHHDDIRVLNRLGYDRENGYFNAGMLLINVDYCRENNIMGKAISFAYNYPDKCIFADNDALNYAVAGKWKRVPARFNCMTPADYSASENWMIRKEYHSDILNAREMPAIIHFTGEFKPWHRECISPLKEIWLLFKTLSPWNRVNLSYKRTGKLLLKYKLRKILERFGILKYYPGFIMDPQFNIDELSDLILKKVRKFNETI